MSNPQDKNYTYFTNYCGFMNTVGTFIQLNNFSSIFNEFCHIDFGNYCGAPYLAKLVY